LLPFLLLLLRFLLPLFLNITALLFLLLLRLLLLLLLLLCLLLCAACGLLRGSLVPLQTCKVYSSSIANNTRVSTTTVTHALMACPPAEGPTFANKQGSTASLQAAPPPHTSSRSQRYDHRSTAVSTPTVHNRHNVVIDHHIDKASSACCPTLDKALLIAYAHKKPTWL